MGGCSDDRIECGPAADEGTISVTLEGLTDADRPYVANYAVTVTEEATGAQDTLVMGDDPGNFGGAVRLDIQLGSLTNVNLLNSVCVEVAGVGWDGTVSDPVNLGCQ
jgi:hypothetical protein